MEIITPQNAPRQTATRAIRLVSANGASQRKETAIQAECALDVEINGAPLMRVICSASHVGEMVLGRLYTEGYISGTKDVKSITVNPEFTQVSVVLEDDDEDLETIEGSVPTCTTTNTMVKIAPKYRETAPVVPIPWEDQWIIQLATTFAQDSPNHKATFGSHSCYLAQGPKLLYCCEDLGRHNALDKVIGCALRDGVDLTQCILFSSGRVPVDMLTKAIRAGVPIMATKAVPTDISLQLAMDHNLTLICSAHPDSMAVFNEPAAPEASRE